MLYNFRSDARWASGFFNAQMGLEEGGTDIVVSALFVSHIHLFFDTSYVIIKMRGAIDMSWKTPEYYKSKYLTNTCEYDVRQEIGCTNIFFKSGYYKDSRWDHYAEYKRLCKNCAHYPKNIGIYFGDGHTTDDIANHEAVWCMCQLLNQSEFMKAVDCFPKKTKALFLDHIRVEELSALEQFPELECVLIDYCPKLRKFWDFSKTPNLRVLEYTANVNLTDLSAVSEANSLEYFGIETLTSRVNLNYVDSFAPLVKLQSLKELSLNSVMSTDANIDNLISIPGLEKLWISPNTYSTEDFAKFEQQKFKIFEEYGIYQNGSDFVCPLGKGKRCFRSDKAKEKFKLEYRELMKQYT